MKKISFILFISTLLSTLLWSNSIDITKKHDSILEYSEVYIDNNHSNLEELLSKNLFKPYNRQLINMGKSRASVWIKITLKNPTAHQQNSILLVKGYSLEHILLYRELNSSSIESHGCAYPYRGEETLFPYFKLSLEPYSQHTYYLKSYGEYLPVAFSLAIDDEKSYIKADKKEQLIYILLLSIIVAFLLYGLVHALYLKDIDYLFYSIYLAFLLYAFFHSINFLHIYFEDEYMEFTRQFGIRLLYIIIFLMILFAYSFLKIKVHSKIAYTYLIFILLTLFGILFRSEPNEESISMVTALTAIVTLYNIWVGVYLYRKGKKVARFYILGFTMVVFSYILTISNALGFIHITLQVIYKIFIITTILEALFLYLAFADRYVIVQKEKEHISQLLLKEAQKRTEIIEQEVYKKTLELNNALKVKEVLLEEIHHRVKNNLQIILSIIQMQSNKFDEPKIEDAFIDLENRINALAKSYDMLIVDKSLNAIEMKPYLETLLQDIQESLCFDKDLVVIESEIDSRLPLKEAVYIGLIINELITNAYKYAFENRGKIILKFTKNNDHYQLLISDTGRGFKESKIKKSLGLNLVNLLVKEKLKGAIKYNNKYGSSYNIIFPCSI